MAFQLEPLFVFEGSPSSARGDDAQQAMSPALLSDDAAWVKAYKGSYRSSKTRRRAVLANPLNVEYDCQLKHGDEGCGSASPPPVPWLRTTGSQKLPSLTTTPTAPLVIPPTLSARSSTLG